ncbi:thioesterase domain-containing protein [Acetatifactor muris]|uniref:Surfactin synthase thioesterase subunit n=1 Tax=Acetatifactor muris TaxID=879566 RepID=A0A2K4ZA77_9FIRM|nr:thioesterase domain-containing protein [Acetatifactor muris]MCR2047468.1 thioesterase domain-containing protein [Acetatifactor muris]SOY27363.1 Surfactin synthase thioesterase subunit [Acetatifactor muris]
MKLICFTCAGGNASFYDGLKKILTPSIELVALEYAGHGRRNREAFYQDFFELAEDMYENISNIINESDDYALMGYSMGSISAVEVLQLILKNNRKLPAHIFLAAHEPYTRKELVEYSNKKNDDQVRKRTIDFGAIPESLIDNKSFWRIYLPIYRADYSIIGKYRFEDLNLKSNIPATIFYSEEDTPYETINLWGDYFTEKCDFVKYKGNHFFINEHCSEIAEEIKNRLVTVR